MELFETNKIQNKVNGYKNIKPRTKRADFDLSIRNKNIEERLYANKQHLQVLFDTSIITAEDENSAINEKRINDLLHVYDAKIKEMYEKFPEERKIIGQYIPINTDEENNLLKFTVNPDKFLQASKKILLLNKLLKANLKINKILNKNTGELNVNI